MYMDKIKQKLQNLPEESGVYVMLDENKSIIYIGKARVLKNRVRQYFHSGTGFNDKTIAMVSRIRDFHYYITPTEEDALALEANLVKKHKPPYNILLKDDKHFPYIRVDLKQQFPKFTLTRKVKKDGAKYYGPYIGGIRVREILDIISSAFETRECNLNFKRIPARHRPCLNYEIGRCSAPCANKISAAQYRYKVLRACDFLSGKDSEIIKLLTDKMLTASMHEQYETAALYRDRIAMVEKLSGNKVAALNMSINIDVIGYYFDGRYGAVSMLFIRDGNMEGVQNFAVSDAGINAEDTISSFITQYYSGDVSAPQQILCADSQQNDALSQYLSQLYTRKVQVANPRRGVKRRLLDMADANAQEYVSTYLEKIKHREDMTLGAVFVLESELKLSRPPLRIECFDISHLSGEQKAASMSVFINGEKQPAHYRRFKVIVPGNNDFASMAEVIRRRFAKFGQADGETGDASFSQMPDLVVIDGGKGQLSYAQKALEEMGLKGSIELISLAERQEEVFFPNEKQPVLLSRSSLGLKLLMAVRDEAHRFGITYHRKLRDNRSKSQLDDIPGIGKTRKKQLLKHFRSVDAIKNATLEQLSSVQGISNKIAAEIVEYFKKESAEKK